MLKRFIKLNWWQVAIVAIVVSAIGGLSSGKKTRKETKLYTKKLKQAPWAPPAWVFAPAWTINNYFLLKALQNILNSSMEEKRKILFLQASIWAIFFSFNYIYFNKKSSILAAIWTKGDAVLAIRSFLLLLKKDKNTAYNFLPLVVWTSFASTVADYQALKNADPLFNTKALLN
ncbi:MAG: TspO/MBR family protein [Ginsengibacter sp.]